MVEIYGKERYSFSKLSSFGNCKYAYKLSYIDTEEGIGNCFSAYGTFLHSLLERYAKGELDLWTLSDTYEWEFDTAVKERFPSSNYCKDKHGKKISMRQLYFQQGLNFFNNFRGYQDINVLGVEKKFRIDVDDWLLDGIIDLVYEDKDRKLVIQDYKTKGSFKSKTEQGEYARQLYLYSEYINREYGKYPDYLRFMMIRKNTPVDLPFDINRFNETFEWAKNTVKEIRNCKAYEPKYDKFFCHELCGHRKHCKHYELQRGLMVKDACR